jgi:hypothetical protein
MLCQNLPAKRINLAESNRGHPSTLEAKTEAADPAE